ncbi:MAG: phosphoribosylanthranilate isomerase [Nitrospinae bacterium CG11_big_fil_rev_8_21_14_0_20_56_8]|nr:MAG: phosphoribosylanthranilate isomerase [Nitrospinae bacterium CG11_big_fil_rev_8_21_14_0_20_56_8]
MDVGSRPWVRVKICGMTRLEDAQLAVLRGADAVGFIFFKSSTRHIAPAEAKKIIAQLPPLVQTVGVFVNETADRVNRIADTCRLDAVQLHGEESPAFCRRIRKKVIKAIRVKDLESLHSMEDYNVSAFLLDSYSDKEQGGTGKTFDWNLVHRAKKLGTIIMAGGLTPSNVHQAVRQVRPFGVDVCSGVEKSPGIKDPAKIDAFMTAVRI